MEERDSSILSSPDPDTPEDQCIVCGNTRHKDNSVSLHRLPRKEPKQGRWLEALDLVEEDLKDFHRVYSRHFLDGDATKDPQLNLGKRFASPKKRWTSRAKRAQKRNVLFCQLDYRYILLIHSCVEYEYSDRSCSALMQAFTVVLVLDT